MKFRSNFWKMHFKKLSTQFILVVAFCVLSYFWLDRSLALLMSQLHPTGKLGHSGLTNQLTALAYFAVLIVMAFYAYMRIAKGKFSRLVAAAGGISLAVPIAFFVKTELQYLFGRIAPRYGDSPTLLFVRRTDLYGLHPFVSGSFPSGHMCVFTAALLMISFYYPKFKPYAIAALSILAGLLLLYNYHFVSDIIAGTYVGFLIAWAIHALQELEVEHPSAPSLVVDQEAHP